MAVAQYYAWDREGRPLEPARPIREFVDKMKLAYPKAAGLFSWYADESHYQAVPPEDHTPYSYTGWPLQNPYPYVFATDVMHRPDLGVDCNVLFPYWLAEAKAGRTPWVKYLIWQAKLYSVRNNWQPQANSGHFDHAHQSHRTDHKDTSIGAWSPTPGGSMANPYTLDNLDRWLSAILTNADKVTGVKAPNGSVAEYPNYLHVPIPTTGGGGGGGLTYEQTVKAAEEGANLAEDS